MIGAIHHVKLRTADAAEARDRWAGLHGLSGDPAADGRALLRCAYEDFCLWLEEAPGEPAGLEHVGWELAPGVTLDDARERLAATDTPFRELEVPGRGSGLRLDDADGHGVVLVARAQAPEADLWPPVARFNDDLPVYHPRKLQHVNFLTDDTPRSVEWYERVLGFRQTDWIGEDACWMHVNPDHHSIAFLDKGYRHIHHLAFELVDWGELRVALDHVGQRRRWVSWGPGRHAMAQNLFAYVRMPEEEIFVELFADMERIHEGHVVRRFPDDPNASNVWGTLPPRTYFRFDAEAVQAERDQLAALGMST
jgi:catechol 2,3-dioxygenase-like lactoylglutathione lyase family enzyme